MRLLCLVLASASLFGGCAKMKSWLPSGPGNSASAPSASPAVAAEISGSGKVAMVNRSAGFVVLTFLPGEVPAVERRLPVYRNGLKVGEVKITGPEKDNNTVADIIAGEPQVNDEVRN